MMSNCRQEDTVAVDRAEGDLSRIPFACYFRMVGYIPLSDEVV
jgi:hypothetical protein